MHGDMALRQAISHVLGDSTFWQLELSSKEARPLCGRRTRSGRKVKSNTATILGKEIQVGVVGELNRFRATNFGNQRASFGLWCASLGSWSLVGILALLIGVLHRCLLPRPSCAYSCTCYNRNHKQNHDHRHSPTFLLHKLPTFPT